MIRSGLIAAASALALAACSSTSGSTEATGATVAPMTETMSSYALAMTTVEGLEEAGNTQTASFQAIQNCRESNLPRHSCAAASCVPASQAMM